MSRVSLIALALLLAACKVPTTPHPTDGSVAPVDMATTSSGAASLQLNLSAAAPKVDGLVLSDGSLEFERPSLFGDVAPDSRTMALETGVSLQNGSHDLSFPLAPYGLYSRAQFSIGDTRAHGTWQGTPFVVAFEAETTKIDLPGPTLDYEPGMSAHFVIALEVGSWLNATSLGGLTPSPTDGTIHIDNTNPSAVTASLGTLQQSFTLTAAP
jgi:hypothetical protein